jgi:predicted ribosome quality control (RQC) complex YloA/Tae2 family protein
MKTIIYNNIQFTLGQNAQDNWNILEQLAKINNNYIWFHLNSFPSSYVIMHCSLEDLRDASYNDFLIYGAQLCKSNSKYKNFTNLKICYTSLKHIKKTQKIGEVIISGKKNIIKL